MITDNTPPECDAGDDQSVDVDDLVTLAGTGTDSDGDSLTYAWEFLTTPSGSGASLSDPAAATTDFTADIKGSLPPPSACQWCYYFVRVVQNDGHVAWSSPIWLDAPQPA